MTDERAESIDVTQLPDDVVALVEGLGIDDYAVITRDGVPIATITATVGVTGPDDLTEPERVDYEGVTVVVTAMKLSESARVTLSTQLGPDYIVLDIRSAPRSADIVLVPPSSPTLIRTARSMFPKARVIVTEIEDAELGVSYLGPVRRMLDAGAEAYLTSTTVPRLAQQLDVAVTQQRAIADGSATPAEIEAAD